MIKEMESSQYLPCAFQNGESARLRLGHWTDLPCRILATKSTAKFVYYDLELWLYPPNGENGEPTYTRLYHVESKFVFPIIDKESLAPNKNAGGIDLANLSKNILGIQ